jgi:hypothetical protein
VAAYSSAVDSSAFFELMPAPLSSSNVIILTSDSIVACISAVVPSASAVFGSDREPRSFCTAA